MQGPTKLMRKVGHRTWRPWTVMLARFPGNAQEHPDSSGWVMSKLLSIYADKRVKDVIPWRLSDTPITMCRNRAVVQALGQEVDYLLMIDSDQAPDVDCSRPFWESSWEFMMGYRHREHVKAVNHAQANPDASPEDCIAAAMKEFPPATIAAPYCGAPPNETVCVGLWASCDGEGPDLPTRLQMIDRDDATRRGGVEEVAALATGLILYDLRVFTILPPPWFDYQYEDPPFNTAKSTTEDIYQTRNASMLGLPQFVNWDAWAGHWKLKLVRRPVIVPVDSVQRSLVDAVRAGYLSDELLVSIRPDEGVAELIRRTEELRRRADEAAEE